MALVCKAAGCVAFAALDADVCAIHRQYPDYHPPVVEAAPTVVDGWERTVVRTECETCDGGGDVTCPSCEYEHPCDKCKGEGTTETVVYVHRPDGEEITEREFRSRYPEAA